MKIIILAIRHLLRFRLYSMINILGLALSLACVIIISRYVYSETTTDHFNKNHERISLSVRHWEHNELEPRLWTTDNVLLRKNYINPLDIPEIERHTSIVSLPEVTIGVDEQKFGAHVLATDSIFLQIMDYPLIEGDRQKLLTDPKDAIITQQLAAKLFGKEDPIGKKLDYNGELLTIRGIIGKPQTQSSLQFDLLISQALQWRWPPVNFFSIALAAPGTDFHQINQKLKEAYESVDNKNFLFQLLPLDKLYMDKTVNKGQKTFRQGNADSIKILSLVALLLLLVGTFNFIHISTVVLQKRERELGMKKVFGARPGEIFLQLYIENLIQAALALFIGWAVIELTQNLQIRELGIIAIVSNTFCLLLSLSLLFGLPLIITSLRVVTPSKRKMTSRSVFLIIQYGITCCLIILSLFFMKQLNYMLHADPGYRTQDIIKTHFIRPTSVMMFTEEDSQREAQMANQVKNAIDSSPLFDSFCYGLSPHEFPDDPSDKVSMRLPGGEWQEVIRVRVPDNYFEFYDIPITTTQPSLNEKEILMNETARKLFTSQGQTPEVLEHKSQTPPERFSVKGFTSEFQSVHLSRNNEPIVMEIRDRNNFFWGKLMARIAPGHRQEAIQFLKKLHEETVGGEFEYSFVEDEISAMYEQDKLVTRIYSVLAFIAILISSLGLFSLSLFDIQQRYKEIAIRKVNGASTWIILKMLLLKYYKLLGVAFLIAVPVSWLAIHKYLENFAHKASVSWWIFAVALLLTAGISLLTLIWQTGKAARTNPAEAIKTE